MTQVSSAIETQLRERARAADRRGHGCNPVISVDELLIVLNTIMTLRGQAGVMRALLRAAHDVIDTVDGETAPGCEMLQDLKNKIRAAYRGSI